MTTRILFATDYSESTDQALTYAASLARDRGATLLVAHVSELEQYPVGELFDEEPQASDEELAKLRAVKPPDPRVRCEHHLLFGDPAEQIVKLADQQQVDAIVIGTHDRSRLARLLGGSVAEKLLRTAHCPVIAYRRPQASPAPVERYAEGKGGASDGSRAASQPSRRQAHTASDADLRRTVHEWAAHRSQLYNVFRAHGIDVLWDGDRPLVDVCREKGINPRHLAEELAAASKPCYRETGTNWRQASVAELCDHIQATHHDYLRRELPRLAMVLAEAAAEGRPRRPELSELATVFDDFRRDLMEHVEVEERRLFPVLRAREAGETGPENEIADPRRLTKQMKDDHDRIGEQLLTIRRLTNGYTPPPGAAADYRTLVGGLWELEANLQLAMREEDEVLFPMVLIH